MDSDGRMGIDEAIDRIALKAKAGDRRAWRAYLGLVKLRTGEWIGDPDGEPFGGSDDAVT